MEMEYEYSASGLHLTLMRGNLALPPRAKAKPPEDHYHTHAWYEVFFADRSESAVHFENETVSLGIGQALLVSPNTVHYAEPYADTHVRVCAFGAEIDEKTDAYASLSAFLSDAPYRTFSVDEMCALLMRSVCASLGSGNGAAAGSYLVSFLFRSAALCAKSETGGVRVQDSRMGRIHKIEQMLFGFYSKELPLSFLAEQLHLSERQLSRVFKKQYGVGYREKNRELRMRSAARMLLKGESVRKVAEAVGYRSESAFYAAFKSCFGLSPAAYRAEKNKK